jgi:hypothetical protein
MGENEPLIAEMLEALKGAGNWLERWSSHQGNCKGGDQCTCGLTLYRFEVSEAIAKAEAALTS